MADIMPRAIDLIEHRYQGLAGPETVKWLRSGAMSEQIDAADDCVQRFIDYELGNDKAIINFDDRSLGSYLKTTKDNHDAREALELALLCSYLTVAGVIGSVTNYIEERTDETLWRWWASRMSFIYLATTPLPPKFVGSIAKEGGLFLTAHLRQKGLKPSYFRRHQFLERCQLVSALGVTLHLGQTEEVSEQEYLDVDQDLLSRYPFAATRT